MLAPEHTAARVALWRALHVLIDAKPPVFADEVGEKLIGDKQWRNRPDMEPGFSKPMRASIVGRARFVEDTVLEEFNRGATQYVILGAGLDSFAQRRPDLASRLQIYEVDQPDPQAWKKRRLMELGFAIPKNLHFVPVDFESGQSWWEKLLEHGFDSKKRTVNVSTGVSMYLSQEANFQTLKQIAALGEGSVFLMTFMLSLELLEPKERGIMEFVMKKAAESRTPFLSLFTPEAILEMAMKAGFKKAQYYSAEELFLRYFSQRQDGLRAGNAEAFLIATT